MQPFAPSPPCPAVAPATAARAVRRRGGAAAVCAAAALLAACAGGPKPGRDGAPARPPGGLAATPDAVPRVEALRGGGPNKPYEVFGRRYVPLSGDAPLAERGLASWYGTAFHGRPTASGERYDMYAMTAAHKTMPLPSYALVRNPANGREIVVRVNDRGPFVDGRVIDLSYTAALKLGVLAGVAPVELRRLTHDEIRAGLWARAAPQTQTQQRPQTPPPPPAEPLLATTTADTADPLMTLVAAADRPETTRTPAAGGVAVAATVAATRPAAEAATQTGPAAAAAPAGIAAAPTSAPTSAPAPAPPAAVSNATAAPGFWLQLGAFRQPDGAAALRRRAQDAASDVVVAVFEDATTWRVQAGPYATRAAAQAAAERLRERLRVAPLLVERRP